MPSLPLGLPLTFHPSPFPQSWVSNLDVHSHSSLSNTYILCGDAKSEDGTRKFPVFVKLHFRPDSRLSLQKSTKFSRPSTAGARTSSSIGSSLAYEVTMSDVAQNGKKFSHSSLREKMTPGQTWHDFFSYGREKPLNQKKVCFLTSAYHTPNSYYKRRSCPRSIEVILIWIDSPRDGESLLGQTQSLIRSLSRVMTLKAPT
jgi:hypothetical protein